MLIVFKLINAKKQKRIHFKFTCHWGCTGWKEGCKFYIGEIAGKKLTDKQVASLFEKGETGKISGFTSKAGKKFDANLKISESGKIEFVF